MIDMTDYIGLNNHLNMDWLKQNGFIRQFLKEMNCSNENKMIRQLVILGIDYAEHFIVEHEKKEFIKQMGVISETIQKRGKDGSSVLKREIGELKQ